MSSRPYRLPDRELLPPAFPELTRELEAAFTRASNEAAARVEATIRRLLERWVSETEPTIVYGPGWQLVGLAGPDGTVVVR